MGQQCNLLFTFVHPHEVYDPSGAGEVERLNVMDLNLALGADINGRLVLTAELLDRDRFAGVVRLLELNVVAFA